MVRVSPEELVERIGGIGGEDKGGGGLIVHCVCEVEDNVHLLCINVFLMKRIVPDPATAV